jgi:Disulphide bond corrector protein DsbC
MSLTRVWFLLASIGVFCVASFAQAPVQPVTWSTAASTKGELKESSRFTLDLSAEIQEGWHVYALNQAPSGPTPLHISLDENGTVQSAGVISGTKPIKQHDAAFGLDTETFTQSFVLHLPVQVKEHVIPGNYSAPVSVRFQSCNDRICLPPKTVHLTVPIQVLP